MTDSVPGIENHPRRPARSVQRQDGLDLNVKRRDVERLEHDLGHLFAVHFRVQGGLGQEDGVFFGSDAQLVVELDGGGGFELARTGFQLSKVM